MATTKKRAENDEKKLRSNIPRMHFSIGDRIVFGITASRARTRSELCFAPKPNQLFHLMCVCRSASVVFIVAILWCYTGNLFNHSQSRIATLSH